MSDPVVGITNGVPTSGTGTITTLGQTLLDGANATMGVTTGAAVTTDAAGTLQQYLRGLAKLFTAVTVKAVSTPPVTATDPALVTVLRPDSPGIITTGTAGTPSSVVLTVQGIAGATPQPVGGITIVQAASSTLTRPATTPTYASGQLFANSATAGSVTNLQWTTAARVSGGSGVVIGAQIQKSGNTVTGAAFRLHLFTVAPTYVTAGDTSPLTTVVVASAKGYLGYIDITTMVGFSDVSWGSGAPDNTRGGIPFVAAVQTLFGLVEVRGAYVGVASEVLTVSLDILQD